MRVENEIKLLRLLTIACLVGLTGLLITFHQIKPQSDFEFLNVQRLNIVEADGTVKMVITNTEHFPTGKAQVNGRILNEDRKKRSGMIFFNEDGIEAGGFIFDGTKTENGHSAGMSLTFDQYNGDQVMQLLTRDKKRGDKRFITSGLLFNDRAKYETQDGVAQIMAELSEIDDKKRYREKLNEYKSKGLIGGSARVLLGKTRSKNNGLFLFAKDGSPRAQFYIDGNDQVKLEVFDTKGNIVDTWPVTKSETELR